MSYSMQQAFIKAVTRFSMPRNRRADLALVMHSEKAVPKVMGS
jgi:hypothetical protein